MTTVTFGKHSGKSVELIVLKFPDYVRWMNRRKNKAGRLQKAMSVALKLIKQFDNKPFVERCCGPGCKNLATRCSLYRDSVIEPYWWCDECDHYAFGARPGHLAVVSTYVQAIKHVGSYCPDKPAPYRTLIRELAKAKGLPPRLGEKQALEFFKSDDEWGR